MPQREPNIDQAKQLLADAGVTNLTAVLHAGQLQEIPDLATLLKSQAEPAGITLNVEVESLDTFYGAQWCPAEPANPPCSGAAELGIVDYGHRATPDVYLNAALKTKGIWNSSQYASPPFDAAFTEFQAAVAVDAQKAACTKIETILNDDVPVGLPYFVQLPRRQLEQVHRGLLERPGADVVLDYVQGRLTSADRVGMMARRPRPPPSVDRVTAEEPMARFIARRLVLSLLTLWLLATIVFVIANVLPNDVGRTILGPFAPQESVDALNERLGHERPDARAVCRVDRRGLHARLRRLLRHRSARPSDVARGRRSVGQARRPGVAHHDPGRHRCRPVCRAAS